jgi:multidrug efflux pump subunit AcrA (membrane-fusion protein)
MRHDYNVHNLVPAEVVVTGLPHHPFRAAVSRTSVSEDYQTRTMRAEIDLPNPRDPNHPDGLLKNGMYGQATLYLGKTRSGVTIPTTALFGPEKEGTRSVYVVRDGKARQVRVRVGLDDGIRSEALSGIGPDDLVVVRHGPGIEDGVPVEVARELSPSEPESGQSHEKAD